MPTFIKDPDSIEDFSVNWKNSLEGTEILTSSEFTVPAGLTKDSESNDRYTSTVWLSGGTALVDYIIVNRVTTSKGRTYDRSLRIACREQ